ncbi:MAG: hypothetical protein KDI55_00265 [Anaerolineae bacterium]|nr:hypothetical protein [Anaerolineae bacterium]
MPVIPPHSDRPTPIERAYVEQGYSLPNGMTWADVHAARSKHAIDNTLVPVAHGRGCTAWAIPFKTGSDGRRCPMSEEYAVSSAMAIDSAVALATASAIASRFNSANNEDHPMADDPITYVIIERRKDAPATLGGSFTTRLAANAEYIRRSSEIPNYRDNAYTAPGSFPTTEQANARRHNAEVRAALPKGAITMLEVMHISTAWFIHRELVRPLMPR